MQRKFTQGDYISMWLRDMTRAVAEHKTADALSRESRIIKSLPLATYFAKRYRDHGIDFGDLIQIANTAVVEAVDAYTPERGTLATWVGTRVKWTLIVELRKHWTCISHPEKAKRLRIISVNVRLPGRTAERGRLIAERRRDESAIECRDADMLAAAVESLTEYERNVLSRRLGGMNRKDVADQDGVKPQSVGHTEKRILQKLFTAVGAEYGGQSFCELGIAEAHRVDGRARMVDAFGERKSISQWCKEFGLNDTMLAHRLKIGMSPEDALLTPSRRHGEKRSPNRGDAEVTCDLAR